MQNIEQSGPDPIDRGLESMHRAIEAHIDPQRAAELASAKKHLAELKAARAGRDKQALSGPREQAQEQATETSPELQDLKTQQQELATQIEELTQKMRTLGERLQQYGVTGKEATQFVVQNEKIGVGRRLGALLWGKTAWANRLLEQLQEVHQSREALRAQKAQVDQQISRAEMVDQMMQ